MRVLVLVLALGWALAAWADGFAYGKSFRLLTETDQVAVIDLGARRVKVDMFIAIGGIPPGETITYVLPFWHRPEGFRMEAMDGKDFQRLTIRPLRPRIDAAQSLTELTVLRDTGSMCVFGGLLTGGPLAPAIMLSSILFPTFGTLGGRHLAAYETVTTPAGSASLYRVETAEDLQALVRAAGLPEQYAEALKKYHTQYYAIVRLKGRPQSEGAHAQGIHFAFIHPVNDEAYTYTYPLGTGGAWPHPIALTEVYLTCSKSHYLRVTAPTIGGKKSARELQVMMRNLQRRDEAVIAAIQPATVANLIPEMRYPTVWHRAYLMSNPTEDIEVRVAPRPFDLAYLIAMRFTNLYVPAALALLGIVLSWVIATRTVLLPYHRDNGITEPLAELWWQCYKTSLLAGVLSGIVAAILLVVALVMTAAVPVLGIVIIPLALWASYRLWQKGMREHLKRFDADVMVRAATRAMVVYLCCALGIMLLALWAHAVIASPLH